MALLRIYFCAVVLQPSDAINDFAFDIENNELILPQQFSIHDET